jgi:hypothetical protein
VENRLMASFKILITPVRYRRIWQDSIKIYLKVKTCKNVNWTWTVSNKIPLPEDFWSR